VRVGDHVRARSRDFDESSSSSSWASLNGKDAVGYGDSGCEDQDDFGSEENQDDFESAWELLADAVKKEWSETGKPLGASKERVQNEDTYEVSKGRLTLQPQKRFRRWSNEESEKLGKYVRVYGTNWKERNEHFPGRTANQCRKRYHRGVQLNEYNLECVQARLLKRQRRQKDADEHEDDDEEDNADR
jgi:hypothetical protein